MKTFRIWLNEIKKTGLDDPEADDFDDEDYDDVDGIEDADEVFGRRDENAKIEPATILKALGLTGDKLEYLDQGSFAIVYKHPTDPNLLIKLTADDNDARNLVKAQGLKTRNIVRVHQVAKIRDHATALVVDYVKGRPMVYGNIGLTTLLNGDHFDDAKDAVRKIMRPDRTRLKVLNQFKKNTPEELSKLSELFGTLARLERMGIDIHDFGDNIHDEGDHYVMIDLGL